MHDTWIVLSPPEVAIITLKGMIDHGAAGTLHLELVSLLDRGYPRIVLDCTKATVICSMAYGAICQVTDRCRKAGGDLRLVGINDHMHRILEVLMVVDWLTFCKDVEAAVVSFRPTPDSEDTV